MMLSMDKRFTKTMKCEFKLFIQLCTLLNGHVAHLCFTFCEAVRELAQSSSSVGESAAPVCHGQSVSRQVAVNERVEFLLINLTHLHLSCIQKDPKPTMCHQHLGQIPNVPSSFSWTFQSV